MIKRLSALFLLLLACSKAAPSSPAVQPTVVAVDAAAAAPADPLVLRVDRTEVAASAVLERRRQLEPAAAELGLDATQVGVQAVLAAATDALVVREFGALGLHQAATETTAQAADRLLQLTYSGERCALTDDDIKLAIMSDLGRYKQPPSLTLWDVQWVCCDDPDTCDHSATAACRSQAEPAVHELHAALRAALAPLPAIRKAGVVEVNASGLRERHLPAIEEAVAAAQARWPAVRLRRYRVWERGHEGFANAPLRVTDPALERAARAAQVGELVGPVATVWGWNIALLAGRSAARNGSADPDAVAEARGEACKQWAARERQDYRERLLRGAHLTWHEAPLRALLGDAVWQRLPPDSDHRALPHIPEGL